MVITRTLLALSVLSETLMATGGTSKRDGILENQSTKKTKFSVFSVLNSIRMLRPVRASSTWACLLQPSLDFVVS